MQAPRPASLHTATIKMVPGLILMAVAAAAQATTTLECRAPPYHVSLVVSNDYGVLTVSIFGGSGELAQLGATKLDVIDLRWPNTVSAAGNRLTFAGRFRPDLDVRGHVEADAGRLVINGATYAFTCDWLM